jgi:hypothetical protein
MNKKIVSTLVCVAAVAGATPAFATNNTLNLSNSGGPTGTYAGVFTESVSAGSFSDNDTFSLPSNLYKLTSVVISSGTAVNIPGFPSSSNIAALTSVSLNGVMATITPTIVTAGGITSATYVAQFASPIWAKATNDLVVSGSAGGISDYKVGITAVYAVPEPATWAIMIGGFGMIGMATMQRRRRTAATA